MQASEQLKSPRRPTNLSLDSTLLKRAKSLGINISRAAEIGIEHAVQMQEQEKWLAENADAIASSNSYIEQNGLPLAKYRKF